MFEAAFSSNDDEVIADTVCVWITGDSAPTGSFVCYLAKRAEEATPLSPRLRRVGIRTIWRTWSSELAVSVSETVRFLNRLEAEMDEVEDKYAWVWLPLVRVVRSPTGFENLSSHYWGLLGELTLVTLQVGNFELRDVEVMKLLEEVEDWEKLEVCQDGGCTAISTNVRHADQRFENLCERDAIRCKTELQLSPRYIRPGTSGTWNNYLE